MATSCLVHNVLQAHTTSGMQGRHEVSNTQKQHRHRLDRVAREQHHHSHRKTNPGCALPVLVPAPNSRLVTPRVRLRCLCHRPCALRASPTALVAAATPFWWVCLEKMTNGVCRSPGLLQQRQSSSAWWRKRTTMAGRLAANNTLLARNGNSG